MPIIASLGGVLFSNELLSSRLIIASLLTLGGILLVLLSAFNWLLEDWMLELV